MADNYSNFYEDISSSSEPIRRRTTIRGASRNYGNGIFRNIGNIIKAIAFIVAIGILIVAAIVAFVLIKLDSFFIVVGIGVGIIGIIFAIIALFLIYGIGHIITQNDEIIRHL